MATKNPRKRRTPPTAPYDGTAITPDDNNDLPNGPCVAIWVGVAGNINVTLEGGTTVLLKGATVGRWHWINAKRVLSTNTTATDLVAGY